MKKSRPFIAGACCGGLTANAAGLAIFLFTAGTDSRARPSVADLALIGGIIEIVERDYVHPIAPTELTTITEPFAAASASWKRMLICMMLAKLTATTLSNPAGSNFRSTIGTP